MVRRASLALLIAVFSAATAAGQGINGNTRFYNGLFGGAGRANDEGLDVNWALLGSYDTNVSAIAPGHPWLQSATTYGTAAGYLRYGARGTNSIFTARGGVNGVYYRGFNRLSALDANADANFTADLNRRTRLTGSLGVLLLPYYQLKTLSLGQPSSEYFSRASDEALSIQRQDEVHGGIQLTQKFSQKNSIVVDYSGRFTVLSELASPFSWYEVNGRFVRTVTRYASLKVGYGMGRAQLGTVPGAAPVETRTIIAGIDYARPLSASRRTTFNFSSGSGSVNNGVGQEYQLLVDAGVMRQIGRTWIANAQYHRGNQFSEGFTDQLYSDSLRVTVAGLVSRRTDLSFGGTYSNGLVGFANAGRGYVTFSGNASLRFALTRLLSLNTEYIYYTYEFDPLVQLPSDIPRNLNRQGLRFGIGGWVPLGR